MMSKWFETVLIASGVLAAAVARAQDTPRPEIAAIRLPDGAVVVDGFDTDWLRAGEDLPRCKAVSADPRLFAFAQPLRGGYAGPDDLSLEAWLATDSAAFYILANVRDQLLANTSSESLPFFGDDFEVFIDASPAAERFAQTKGDNFRQLVFVPAYVNTAFTSVLIWSEKDAAGVAVASRARPWGYTIELKIPKALFPNWQAHPDLDSIGFDIGINEADAPGVDCAHPAIKGALMLLKAAPHFMSPRELGLLHLEQKPAALAQPLQAVPPPSVDQLVAALPAATDATAADLAQQVLDFLPRPEAALAATAALGCKQRPLQRAALYVFAKRPEAPAPAEAIQAFLAPAANAYGGIADVDLHQYAMMALAPRGKLPTVPDIFGLYARAEDPALRLTYVWALGVNGDRAIVPELVKLLYDGNLRVRMMAALSLGLLSDPLAIEPLKEMAAHDPHHYGRNQADISLKRIQAK